MAKIKEQLQVGTKEQQTNLKLDELVDTWARGKSISTTDFFWLIDTVRKLSATEAKYESLVSMFDQVANITVGAWETMLKDQENQ